jgi:hypothetical protein
MDYAEIVSSLALITSVIALGWNIVRDLIKDSIAVDFRIAFGEIGNIKNTPTGLFADAGSLPPSHKFDEVSMMVQIVNTGHKTIGISNVGGSYKKGGQMFIATNGLPKMLEPHEVFSSVSKASEKFLNEIENNEIRSLWVSDTTGKNWFLKKKGWERMKRTAKYITQGNHQ